MAVYVTFNQFRVGLSGKEIRKIVEKVFTQVLKNKHLNVSLVFSNDQAMKKLNSLYRGKSRTTDVLSFNLGTPLGQKKEWGEIYLSVPQARRQAAEVGHSLKREVVELLIHACLHLAGFDHKGRDEARAMFGLQEKILVKLNTHHK